MPLTACASVFQQDWHSSPPSTQHGLRARPPYKQYCNLLWDVSGSLSLRHYCLAMSSQYSMCIFRGTWQADVFFVCLERYTAHGLRSEKKIILVAQFYHPGITLCVARVLHGTIHCVIPSMKNVIRPNKRPSCGRCLKGAYGTGCYAPK